MSGRYRVGADAIKHRAEVDQVLFAVEVDGKEIKRYPVPGATVGPKKVDATTWLAFAEQFKADKADPELRFKAELKDLKSGKHTDNDVYLDDVVVIEAMPKRFQMLAFSVHADAETSTDFFMAVQKDGKDPQVYLRTPDASFNHKDAVLKATEAFVSFETVPLADKAFAFKVTNFAGGKNSYLTAVDGPGQRVLVQVKEHPGDAIPEAAKFELIAPPLTDEVGAVEKGYRSFKSKSFKDCYVRHGGFVLYAYPKVEYDAEPTRAKAFDLFNKDASWRIEPLGVSNPAFMNLPSGQYTATLPDGRKATIIVPAEGVEMDLLFDGKTYGLVARKAANNQADLFGRYEQKGVENGPGGSGALKRTPKGFTYGVSLSDTADLKAVEFTKASD
ncbi:MAG TPA: hypothetical protein VEA69_19375 [Tepidisphaeraceae bacterium]|nr:hypothetical protein [Tepidisphaeraceae bacterium]